MNFTALRLEELNKSIDTNPELSIKCKSVNISKDHGKENCTLKQEGIVVAISTTNQVK